MATSDPDGLVQGLVQAATEFGGLGAVRTAPAWLLAVEGVSQRAAQASSQASAARPNYTASSFSSGLMKSAVRAKMAHKILQQFQLHQYSVLSLLPSCFLCPAHEQKPVWIQDTANSSLYGGVDNDFSF